MSSDDETATWKGLCGAFEEGDSASQLGDKDHIGRIEVESGQYEHVCQDGRIVQISDNPEKVFLAWMALG